MDKNFLKKLYENFNSERNNNFVLGLSGGPDSFFLLCCLKLINDDLKSNKLKIFPIIIDHKLRKESSAEAVRAQKNSLTIGFKAKIIEVKDKYSSGNIQNWARNQRRNILYHYAKKYNANIMLAHHYDDNIETIFMRVLKKSGFEGLIGIKKISQLKDIKIYRPLLDFKKKQIIGFLDTKKIPYVIDKSNFNRNFDRVKTRYILKSLQNFDFKNVETNLLKLSLLSEKFVSELDEVIRDWITYNVKYYSHGSISVEYSQILEIFKKNQEFSSILVGKFIKNVGGRDFFPRKKKLVQNLKNIFANVIKKFTTGNVIIYVKDNMLNFVRENRNMPTLKRLKKNTVNFFDNRFIIYSKFNGKIFFSPIETLNVVNLEKNKNFVSYSKNINSSLPLLKTLEGQVIKPYVYTIDKKNLNEINTSISNYDLVFIKDNS